MKNFISTQLAAKLKPPAKNGIIKEKRIDVEMDDLTPCLKERATGEIFDTKYYQVTNQTEMEEI